MSTQFVRFAEMRRSSFLGRAALAAAISALGLLALTPTAPAKEVVDYFEGGRDGVAVNDSGAGGVPAGTIYSTLGGDFNDPVQRGNKVLRFQRNDSGTPADFKDDTYTFVSAWGAGVVSGDTDFEICTVQADCRNGTGQGGNGTVAGNGSLNKPAGIAVDQDSGQVYVVDSSSRNTADNHFRINVYGATGEFLRSFGWDVVESGPGDNGTGYEVCVSADGDVCKAGVPGAGAGQIGADNGNGAESLAISPPDGHPATGTVFLADRFNHRVNTYDLDGGSPGSFGSGAVFADFGFGWDEPQQVAVDSRGIVYASNLVIVGAQVQSEPIERYDTENANGTGVGFLDPIPGGVNETQEITVAATAGTFDLSFDPDGAGPEPEKTVNDIPYNAKGGTPQSPFTVALTELLGSNTNFRCCGLGGPGDGTGSTPYTITFSGAYGAIDVPEITVDDSNLSGGAGASVSTIAEGQSGLIPNQTFGLAVDPDSDGAGSDTDVLYALRGNVVQQFGPANPPGLTAAPTEDDDRYGTTGVYSNTAGVAVEPSSGRIYVAANDSSGDAGPGVFVLDEVNPNPPEGTLDALTDVTERSITAQATIDPKGLPVTSYRLEYSSNGGSSWSSTPSTVLGGQEVPQALEIALDPPPLGLEPNTDYLVRLVFKRRFSSEIVTAPSAETTLGAAPISETTGAPIRTTTTADLTGRVIPSNAATTYRFQYGTLGPCSAHACDSTPASAAGSDNTAHLVAERITGLDPDTTYHYRLLADNGTGGEVAGADMTVRTRASEELPNQSEFPGPPDSDRAWELVSIGDSGGNPVGLSEAFSDDGNRSVYGIFGGTPISTSGAAFSLYFSERPPGAHPTSGWQAKALIPTREELAQVDGSGLDWTATHGASDLSTMVAANGLGGSGPLWRLDPNGSSRMLVAPVGATSFAGQSALWAVAGDGTRTVAALRGGTLDPAFPAAALADNVYDVSADPPRLLSLLPDDSLLPCGARFGNTGFHPLQWVSSDGSLVFFYGDDCESTRLYVRDVPAETTKALPRDTRLVRAVPGAAFLSTTANLDPARDADDNGNDVYRYDLASEEVKCVTCVGGSSARVSGTDLTKNIAVADDGSRVYFASGARLAPGASGTSSNVYRAMTADGDVALVGSGMQIEPAFGRFDLTADGSQAAFFEDSARLDPLGGTARSDGTEQAYFYNDVDRSLTCVSCPGDGSSPLAPVPSLAIVGGTGQTNHRPLAENGNFAFATATPLVGADQNTSPPDPKFPAEPYRAGTDVYEYRDGRVVLVSDGLTSWLSPPSVEGITRSGRDIFFIAAARYTPDAIDANRRVYTARIGGGIDFPPAELPPCDLNSGACEGASSNAHEPTGPGTAVFEGSSDPKDPFPRDCSAASKSARKLNRAARRLGRAAARAAGPRRARILRRKAKRRSAAAKRRRAKAKRCRRAAGRKATANRRNGR